MKSILRVGIEDVIEVSRDVRKQSEVRRSGKMWRIAFLIRLTNWIAGQGWAAYLPENG